MGTDLRGRPGEPPRRAGHQRRLGRAHALGHPLRRPHRRRPRRLHDRGRRGSRTPPTRRARSRPSSSSWPAGPSPRTPTAEIAIMMVEAGGTEKSWGYYEAGAPKVTEEVLARASRRPRPGSASPSTCSAAWSRPRRPRRAHRTIAFSTFTDYEDDVWARVEAVGTDPIAKANLVTEQGRAQRGARRGRRGDPRRPRRRVRRPRAVRSRRPSARSPRSWCASASSRTASASTAGASPTSARSRPRSTCSRRHTARRSSSVARPRCSTSPPWACPA